MAPKDRYNDIAELKKRIRLMLFFLYFFGAVIVTKLAYLQVFKHNYYIKLAAAQHWQKDRIEASRGKIYVRDEISGEPFALADNLKLQRVCATPEHVKNKELTAKKVAEIVSEDSKKIQEILENNKGYAVLKAGLDYEKAKSVIDLGIEGIYLQPMEKRYYPEGSLASQLLGYVDSEGSGKYGLEQLLDDELGGVPGLSKAEVARTGKKIAFGDQVLVEPKDGADITLTLNRDVQYEAEKIIKSQVEKYSAENGTLIVMRPDNGEIVAMANYPSYDPNKYQEVKDYKRFTNSAVSDVYEPGSIFKVITMAAGLDTGKVEPETEFEDTGKIILNGHKIMNSDKKSHGWVNMTFVLVQSLNTGTVHVLNSIGKEVFYSYLKKFGFGVKTGIEQPNEGEGRIYSPGEEGINDHTYATMSFGQSLSTTPIQMITSFAAIANGGELVKPHLIYEKQFSSGKKEKTKIEKRRVISESAAAKERKMLVEVVEKGHGYQAKIKGYKIGGKTGTAQVPKKDGRGYDPNKNIGSFVGIAPIDSPEFVVLAKVDSPKGVPWAETSAAPAVGKMFDFLFKYYQIPPTETVK